MEINEHNLQEFIENQREKSKLQTTDFKSNMKEILSVLENNFIKSNNMEITRKGLQEFIDKTEQQIKNQEEGEYGADIVLIRLEKTFLK